MTHIVTIEVQVSGGGPDLPTEGVAHAVANSLVGNTFIVWADASGRGGGEYTVVDAKPVAA